MDYDQWPWITYPDHVLGATYLISRVAVHQLLSAAQVTPYFSFEDIYVGGILSEIANVTIRQSTNRRYSTFFYY